jgi:hypothetical protein
MASAFAVAACHSRSNEGPAERAGEKIDKGISKLGEKMEEGGERLQEKAQGR